MLSVNFKVPGGPVINERNFEPGERVEIFGKTASSLGVPEGIPVTISIQVDGDTAYANVGSSWLGNYSATVNMPYTQGTGKVIVVAEWPVGGNESKTIPISVGSVSPPPWNAGAGIPWGTILVVGGLAAGTILVAANYSKIKSKVIALPGKALRLLPSPR